MSQAEESGHRAQEWCAFRNQIRLVWDILLYLHIKLFSFKDASPNPTHTVLTRLSSLYKPYLSLLTGIHKPDTFLPDWYVGPKHLKFVTRKNIAFLRNFRVFVNFSFPFIRTDEDVNFPLGFNINFIPTWISNARFISLTNNHTSFLLLL